MDDLISRAAAIEALSYGEGCKGICARAIRHIPAVDAVPIKPLSVWLAGYAVPPKYTVSTNPVDSAKDRAEGWERHIRNMIECGLMEDE